MFLAAFDHKYPKVFPGALCALDCFIFLLRVYCLGAPITPEIPRCASQFNALWYFSATFPKMAPRSLHKRWFYEDSRMPFWFLRNAVSTTRLRWICFSNVAFLLALCTFARRGDSINLVSCRFNLIFSWLDLILSWPNLILYSDFDSLSRFDSRKINLILRKFHLVLREINWSLRGIFLDLRGIKLVINIINLILMQFGFAFELSQFHFWPFISILILMLELNPGLLLILRLNLIPGLILILNWRLISYSDSGSDLVF